MLKQWLQRDRGIVVALLIPLAVGAVSGLITMNSMQQFEALPKPDFAPPGWAFGVVWPILYLLMGLASWRVWRTGDPRAARALLWYALQLGVNFLWPIFFFTLQWWLFAFWWIILLIVLVVITAVSFYQIDRAAAWLLSPYLIWLLYAAWLDFQIWQLLL